MKELKVIAELFWGFGFVTGCFVGALFVDLRRFFREDFSKDPRS